MYVLRLLKSLLLSHFLSSCSFFIFILRHSYPLLKSSALSALKPFNFPTFYFYLLSTSSSFFLSSFLNLNQQNKTFYGRWGWSRPLGSLAKIVEGLASSSTLYINSNNFQEKRQPLSVITIKKIILYY